VERPFDTVRCFGAGGHVLSPRPIRVSPRDFADPPTLRTEAGPDAVDNGQAVGARRVHIGQWPGTTVSLR
jgi:hypothetical protein